MLIRDAEQKDVPRILDLVNALVLTTTTEWTETPYTLQDRCSWLERQQQAAEPVIVAEIDGEVVGFACYSDFRDSKKWPGYRFAVEHTIHVDGKCWRRGVGRSLIEALSQRAVAAGKRVMVAAVDGENVGSIRFHERCGFVEVARMPDIGFKFDRWLTLVLLQRRLGD